MTQYSITFIVNNLGLDNSIFHMVEIPGKKVEFALTDLLSVLSGKKLSLIGSHLESIFPHLGVVHRPNHCSIYIHDLLSNAVSAEHCRDILKRSSIWVRKSTKMNIIRQIFFVKNEGFFEMAFISNSLKLFPFELLNHYTQLTWMYLIELNKLSLGH